ncbi:MULTISPECIES: DUF4232 domain-containing protein [Streptomyces]|uniref:DUF4232 domain-containing protein n=2 Tax=Streptomyces TaxID=1883 RepID=A0ABT9LMT1_STRGD|nr:MULTISPECIES: DUF4232 domain-containing protein [Streptomyces]MDP9684814.1 hypothetical protein [Streptomyces griseoviridis]GGT19418.1 hypothetical protein GCM10010240_60500 [Streptomyces griseoviridis]GGU47125.1 hypothetical protein GCM10010259_42780 [Streptomyces daghestanicus]GHI30227.1 hypothetical protein Sdagh_19570 [Streptomyces daghestanicus]
MRAKKSTLLAVAFAAGLSLTACQSDDTASTDAGGSAAAPVGDSGTTTPDPGTETSAPATSTSPESGANADSGVGTCSADQLALSQNHGMGEGDILVHLKNTGDVSCRLKGFPGVDLKGADGTVSADRSDLAAPLVTVAPGDEARFTLHYTPNLSGGSGVTYTTMVVTPPNETHSLSVPVTVNVAATDSPGATVSVDPVGTGK